MKTQKDIDELDEMNNSPIDYSDIPPLTARQRENVQSYYKEFLEKLPPDMVKELARRRLEEIKTAFPDLKSEPVLSK